MAKIEISSVADLTLWIIEMVVKSRNIDELVKNQLLITKVVSYYKETVPGIVRKRMKYLVVDDVTSKIELKYIPWS